MPNLVYLFFIFNYINNINEIKNCSLIYNHLSCIDKHFLYDITKQLNYTQIKDQSHTQRYRDYQIQFQYTNTKHTGYWNGDLQCTAKCQAQDGISCGQAWQNCCRPSQCISEWYGAKNCKDRIQVPGCSDDEN